MSTFHSMWEEVKNMPDPNEGPNPFGTHVPGSMVFGRPQPAFPEHAYSGTPGDPEGNNTIRCGKIDPSEVQRRVDQWNRYI